MQKNTKIRIVQCGLGPLGVMTVRRLLDRRGFELVGVVDKSPDLVGKRLSELVGPEAGEIVVEADLGGTIRRTRPDVCLIMTVSDLVRIVPQVEEALDAGVHVVSTCEELSYPWERDRTLAERLDARAKAAGLAVLGTGVNPGYMMDFLPQTLSGLCHQVDSVLVERYQDASSRRLPFQRKIGAGLSLEAFRKKFEEGTLRHVGLEESVHLIASQLGWTLDRTADVLEPVVATESWSGEHLRVEAGQAMGVRQVGSGYRGDREVIRLVFHAAVGEPNPRDRVVIEGEPRIDSTIAGGVQGDVATCSIALNTCHTIRKAAPGLHHMASLPPVCWYSGEGAS